MDANRTVGGDVGQPGGVAVIVPHLPTATADMEEVDSRVWCAGLAVAPYGARIGVRLEDPDRLNWLRSRMLPGWQELEQPEVDFLWSIGRDQNLYYGSHLFFGSAETEFDRYFHLYVGETAKQRVFFHAGAVSFAGKGLILPSPSFGGKTTLTRALVRAGATLYSDDLAVVDPQRGLLYPYPKPISVRKSGSEAVLLECPPGTQSLPGVPLSLVVGLRYEENAELLTLQSADSAESSRLLIENALAMRASPKMVLDCLARLMGSAAFYLGIRGEADQAACALLKML